MEWWKMYKRILLAVDGSEHSKRAAKEVVKIASCNNESLVELVYVADFAHVKDEMLHSQSTEEIEHARRSRLRPVEDLMKESLISYEVKVLHGEPGPAIVEYANDEEVNLVVIGSRGLNSLQEMVLGSVSHKVVKRVNCPVLIVK
jgi:nucleotide-binding universal stress UspA family protein